MAAATAAGLLLGFGSRMPDAFSLSIPQLGCMHAGKDAPAQLLASQYRRSNSLQPADRMRILILPEAHDFPSAATGPPALAVETPACDAGGAYEPRQKLLSGYDS